MKKNEVVEVEAHGYTYDGLGAGHYGDMVLFIPGLIEGEIASCSITAMKKNYGYARIQKIIEPSKHRQEPICDVFSPCGGCQLMHMDLEEQHRMKQDKVKYCFLQNAKMDIEPLPILSTKEITGYRNKVQVPIQVNHGKVEMGFYRKRSNDIVPFSYCHVQTPLSNQIIQSFQGWLEKYSCAKSFRYLLLRHTHERNEVMVCMIVREYPFPHAEELVEQIVQTYPQVKSVIAIINRREDNVIVDGKEVVLYGNPYIEEELLGSTFRISARSFFQINPYTTKLLYQTAIDYAQLTGNEIVVDLYCGTGTIGLLAARHAKKVYGIEVVEDAIKDARVNAKQNQVENIDFLVADANVGANQFLKNKIHPDVVIVDPPRKGCTKDTLDAIGEMNPKRIVYVSCDPATLARDCAYLKEKGYEVQQVQPVDMFPLTQHVETVVSLFQPPKKRDSIKIDVDVSKMEPTITETQHLATYDEIKKYCKDKYGLKVSTLYISQVKHAHGLEMRPNYNISKSAENRTPRCPDDKWAAIEDALAYFKLI